MIEITIVSKELKNEKIKYPITSLKVNSIDPNSQLQLLKTVILTIKVRKQNKITVKYVSCHFCILSVVSDIDKKIEKFSYI